MPCAPTDCLRATFAAIGIVYGAQIPDDQVEPIAQYLARAYGDGG